MTWGTTVSCRGCHDSTGTSELDDLGTNFWFNGQAATINVAEWMYSGHGKDGGTYEVSGNDAGNFATSPTPGTSECMYCHDDAVPHDAGMSLSSR